MVAMSEASIEPDYQDMERDPPRVPAPSGMPGDDILFASRYRIQPGVILPQLCTSSAKAYLASDAEDSQKSLYALVLDRAIPARHSAIVNAKGIVHEALAKPLRWGRVSWNDAGREEIVIILPAADAQSGRDNPALDGAGDQTRFPCSDSRPAAAHA
jgi:hypothetical protein